MAEEVKMPQMGESIAEGTIIKWLKHVGDAVKRDEPLFEISTDKVDAEIPAPASGVLSEIKVQEGETVAINTVVAIINGDGKPAAEPAEVEEKAAETPEEMPEAAEPPQLRAEPPQPPQPSEATREPATAPASQTTEEEDHRIRSSPLVRKIASEYGIDVSQIEGTGIGGRVTKNDILSFIENRGLAPKTPAPAREAPPEKPAVAERAAERRPQRAVEKPQRIAEKPPQRPPERPAVPQARPQPLRIPAEEAAGVGPPPYAEGDRVQIVPMSVMRKRIAEHMVQSKRTSAHVTSFMEVDFTETAKLRRSLKGEYLNRDGVKLTFLPFILKAVIEGINKWPIINSSLWGDQIVYKKDINIGVAVALDWGLIVPVIRNADEKSLLGLARAVNDLGERARTKQLKPDEVQGGTFTITNPGIFGGLIGTPIINQPQVAILGVGVIKKRPVVINDAIAIREIGVLALSFDHRIIDGAVGDQFLAAVRDVIDSATYNS